MEHGKALEHDERPWGSYTVLANESDHKVKRIVVKPGKRLSLQSHRFRSEHWFAIQGTGLVTLNEKQIPLQQGLAIDIPQGARHRVANESSDLDFVFIETQTGSYFGEDDIERYEDDFGRV